MNGFESKWQRLITAARQAPETRDAAAPYGFSTRIAARALSDERPARTAMFARISVRALWVACLLTLVSVATNYLAFASSEDDEQNLIDPVSDVLNAS
jgi:hypothetical protein